MVLRDVTGRVSRWTLILHRDEQGFVNAARRLTAGGSTHHIGSVSFRSPAHALAQRMRVRFMRHRGV
jgi:hypothetical protein